MSTSPHIVVVGDVIDDVQAVTSGPIRPDTDTLADIEVKPGGSAANTACWVGYLGQPVTFHGRVGANDLARHTVDFERFGVTPVLQADEDYPTGTIVVIVYDSTRSMLTDRGANLTLDVCDVCVDDSERPNILHLTGYSFFHRDSVDDLLGLMERTTESGGQVMIDCSSSGFLADRGADWWWEIASRTTIVKGNEDEAAFLTGLEGEQAAQAMAAKGVTAIVTRGADGVSWCEPGAAPASLPALPPSERGLVDPTGAGDSFSGGFIVKLAENKSIRECVEGGLAASAEAISRRGARPWLPQTH